MKLPQLLTLVFFLSLAHPAHAEYPARVDTAVKQAASDLFLGLGDFSGLDSAQERRERVPEVIENLEARFGTGYGVIFQDSTCSRGFLCDVPLRKIAEEPAERANVLFASLASAGIIEWQDRNWIFRTESFNNSPNFPPGTRGVFLINEAVCQERDNRSDLVSVSCRGRVTGPTILRGTSPQVDVYFRKETDGELKLSRIWIRSMISRRTASGFPFEKYDKAMEQSDG